tara:strand:- start:108 stop:257 length:150 start_codon:yes stop_codon:yes gene_type:complete
VEHVLHIFGGGCGEHLIWPWLATVGTTASGIWWWAKSLLTNTEEKKDET